jgi:hypothetical protein
MDMNGKIIRVWKGVWQASTNLKIDPSTIYKIVNHKEPIASAGGFKRKYIIRITPKK